MTRKIGQTDVEATCDLLDRQRRGTVQTPSDVSMERSRRDLRSAAIFVLCDITITPPYHYHTPLSPSHTPITTTHPYHYHILLSLSHPRSFGETRLLGQFLCSRTGRIEKIDFRKDRFPIHCSFDGMCLDTFLIVSRIEFVVFVFVLFLGAIDTRE